MKHIAFTTTLWTAVSLSSFGHLYSDTTDAQVRSLENRVSALEQKKGSSSMINPPGRPQVRDGIDLFLTADWLIWQGHENGTGYGVKTKNVQPTSSALYNSDVKNLSFNWNSGFRVGLGYNLPHDGWDLKSEWTWFQNTAKGHATDGTGRLFAANSFDLSQYNYVDQVGNSYASANAKLKIKLNFIDLDLGREFFVSKWMTLRPFIGLRSAWVYQTYTSSLGLEGTTARDFFSKAKNNYWGLGLHSGLNSQWGMGAGFSLFGNADFSILNGFFQVSDYLTTEYRNNTHNDNISNTDSFRIGRVITGLAMGLRWETLFANDHAHFQIQAGWEQQMLFGQNQFKHFYSSFLSNAGSYFANQGDLTFQGWTLSTRFDF